MIYFNLGCIESIKIYLQIIYTVICIDLHTCRHTDTRKQNSDILLYYLRKLVSFDLETRFIKLSTDLDFKVTRNVAQSCDTML